jgi:hypothetical protein
MRIRQSKKGQEDGLMSNQANEALYSQALHQGRRGQLWSGLAGRSRGLLSLEKAGAAHAAQAPADKETRTVPICRIRGSESRGTDFDRDFNPLQTHTRERWLGIAAARQRGRNLPPVALIQVGDVYFVRDGHHRISVARALGYATVEATVEVWQVDGPLPWEELAPANTRHRADQLVEQLRQRVRDDVPALVTSFAQRFTLASRQGNA